MKIEEIPKWAIAVTWILVIGLFCLLVYFIIFLKAELDILKLMGDACSICESQKRESFIKLTEVARNG